MKYSFTVDEPQVVLHAMKYRAGAGQGGDQLSIGMVRGELQADINKRVASLSGRSIDHRLNLRKPGFELFR